jgi:hypothetical protein
MGTVTVLRPSATSSGVGWTPNVIGTLHGVTSDDSDGTYAAWNNDGSPLILATPADAPPTGERRHQVRLRARGEDGDAWWAVRLSSGALAAGAAAQFPASPETVVGSWGFGAPADGSTVLYTYVTAQSSNLRIVELYLDVDSREAPTFTPQILDGSGAVTTTIGDTAQPVIRANAIDLDGLNARQYRYWVTLNGAVVWDTGVISGTAVNQQTAALDNGSYVAHLQIWSTLGQNTAYESEEQTLAFTVTVGQVAQPENPTVEPVENTPFYEIEACAPNVSDMDGAVGYVEVQRVDCPVGGYLLLPGSEGAYASTPTEFEPGGETVLYDFEVDAEGWTDEGGETVQRVTSPVPGGTGASIQIPDGAFSGSVTDWYNAGGSFAYSTAESHSPPGSALTTVSGSPGQAYVRPNGPANSSEAAPARQYRATTWIRSSVPVADAGVAIDWFDSGVGYLDTGYLGGALAANTWTPMSAVFTAPVDTFYASHGPTWVSPANGALLYADDIDLAEVAVHDGTGALEGYDVLGSGLSEMRFNDGVVSLRDLTVLGEELTAWVLVPANATGTGWSARLELQDPSSAWVTGPDFALTPGTWLQISFEPDPALMASCRAIGITFEATDVNGPAPVYMDTVTVVASGSGPAGLTDLEVIVHAQRSDDWRPATWDETLVAHWREDTEQRSWRLTVDSDAGGDPALIGRPLLFWSTDGTAAGVELAYADDRPPIDPYGRVWLRATLDTDNGAGAWVATFYTRPDEDSPWVVLGAPTVGGSTTSLHTPADVPITVGGWLSGATTTSEPFLGRVYSIEVRDGENGEVMANPDFTNHLDGTTSFVDGVGNVWTVTPPASIYSPVSTVTVAMLGPLASSECGTWIDYTLPRSGIGLTCDHQPEQCCSYYRARTVGRIDGSLRISDWSDVFDPAIPAGVLVMWPGTDASVPDGWTRDTGLDGRYAKGIPDGTTDPGATGGAATHSHTTPGHTHDTSHFHTTAATTAAATGTVNAPNTGGALKVLTSHTHTRPSTDSATVASGSSSPGTATAANDPARLEVIWAESDGSSLGVPDGALAFTSDISLSGWTDYADAASRFFKGAAAAGNGGTTAASAVDSHTHTIDGHTHTGTAHVHTSANTGSTASTLAPATGSGAVLSAATHSHPITVNSASTQSLTSFTGGSSGAAPADMRPPFRNLRVKENVSGGVSLPIGLICAWRGPLDSIPVNWQLCDGTNGTPDMFGLYPQGATASIGTTGGSLAAHTHTGGSHTHPTTGHAHTSTTGASTGSTTANTTATVAIATATHTHALTDTVSTTPGVGSAGAGTLASTTSEPPYAEVAFIQMMEELVPPPDPDTFCLTWDQDEHLIRTTGPDGPIWAPVLGKFEWTVERPFTAATGVNGSRFVTSAPPGGRNLAMTAAVESEAELAQLRAVLARPLVLISPSDSDQVWAAPVAESVRIVKIGRIRQVTASFIGTGPQPPPQLADVGV